MVKFLTNRDMFKAHACDALGGAPALTKAERYAQVVEAKKLRNFWFTGTIISSDITAPFGALQSLTSRTPRFALPVIITDMLAMLINANGFNTEELIKITRYSNEGGAYGEDLFNLSSRVFTRLLLKYERNHNTASGLNPDMPDKFLPFIPLLLRPYEFLKIECSSIPDSSIISANSPYVGFRAVRPLPLSSPYCKLSPLADRQVRSYIENAEPETFLLEVKTPLAGILTVAPLGGVQLRTPQQGRPLLILGAATNAEGCQVRITNEGEDYQFTYQEISPIPPTITAQQNNVDPPLVLVAANTDYRNVNAFNMWPVPHVLEPGASLKILLTGGTIPAGITGDTRQPAATRSEQDVRITFLCRTV